MLAHYIFWSSQEALVPRCLLCMFANTLSASIYKVNQSFLWAWLLDQHFPCSKEKDLLSKSCMSIYHWLASSPWAYSLLHFLALGRAVMGHSRATEDFTQQWELLLLHYSKILTLDFKVMFPFSQTPLCRLSLCNCFLSIILPLDNCSLTGKADKNFEKMVLLLDDFPFVWETKQRTTQCI